MRWLRSASLMGLALAVTGLVALSGPADAAEVTLKLGHVAPLGVTHDIAANKFAELVARESSGRIEIKVHGNSQFGNLQEHWAQIKTGAIDLFLQDAGAAFMVEPPPKNFIITLFPYLFDSQEHFHKFCESELFKKMMAKVEEAAQVKYLGYVGDRAPRGFSTTDREVATLDQIKGLKLRVPEVPPFVAAYQAWGASPTPIQAKDMYTALKSGMVMGMDQDLVSFHLGKYHEIQKYFTALDYMRSGLGVWINSGQWAKLSEEDRAVLLKAARETGTQVNQVTAQELAEVAQKLSQAGLKLVHPDLEPWQKAVQPIFQKSEGKMWEAGLYDRIKALK